MKKLKFTVDNVHAMLSREQMKAIKGGTGVGGSGSGGGTCGAYLPYNIFTGGGGSGGRTCTYSANTTCGTTTTTVLKGISYDSAICLTEGITNAHWCCDSCSTASWYTGC